MNSIIIHVKEYQDLRCFMAINKNMKKAIEEMIKTDKTQRQIAEEIGVSEETISRWKTREDYNREYKKVERKYFNSLTAKAIRTLIDLLDSDNDNVRLGASKEILDRNGYKATEKVDLEIIKPEIVFDVDDGK